MWRELYKRSSGLRGPLLFKSDHRSPISFDQITSILSGARDAPGSTKLNYFRGYIDGREDYRLAQKLLEQDFDSSSIEPTIQQLFARNSEMFGERPGLVINGGLQWSEDAQQALAAEADRLAATVEEFFTLDLTLFIGSYGSTPFGAHVDDVTHRTILFNLGPSEKTVKVWGRNEIERQFGRVRNIYDLDEIAVSANDYMLTRGDCFILPSNDFHVAFNEDVSTTVALVLDCPGEGALAEQELSYHSGELDRLGASHPLIRVEVAELASLARTRRLSNCRLRYPIQWKPSGIELLRRDSVLRLTTPFRLRAIMLNGAVVVYSRGRHYISFSPVSRSISTLDDAGQLSVKDFIGIAEQDGCEIDAALRIIEFLLATSGVSYG